MRPLDVSSILALAYWTVLAVELVGDRSLYAITSLASRGLVASFLAVFLSEWEDLGQMSVAAIAARTAHPVAVWLGASAALMTKGLIPLTVGVQLRRTLPASASRLFATASCVALGAFALRGALAR